MFWNSTSKENKGEKIIDELPADLKAFFDRENSIYKINDLGLDEKIDMKSKAGLAKLSYKQREEFNRYCATHSIRSLVTVNCIPAFAAFVKCIEKGESNFYNDSGKSCADLKKANEKCEVKNKAAVLEMGYNKAYTIEMKQNIQKISLLLHKKHFGDDGLNIDKISLRSHWDDVMKSKREIWE